MRRITKVLLALALLPVAGVSALILGLLVWGYTEFPGDTDPPDLAAIPPNVIAGFERHLGHDPDWFAVRLFLHREKRVMPQLTYNVAGTTAWLWISAFWSHSERVAEITQQAYFGHGFFGVESAARGYFGRPSAALSPEEVAALAFLTRSPSGTSPWCRREVFVERVLSTPAYAGIAPDEMLKHLLPAPAGACEPAG